MDPNNPGQTPGDPTRPSWGSAEAPDQTGASPQDNPYGAPYGAPPAPDQPGFAAPPAMPYGSPYGAPPAPDQPGFAAPPAMPYGSPYGAPPAPDQPGFGGPPAMPYGAPPAAWGVAAPTARSSVLPRIVGAVVGIVVLAVAAVFIYGVLSGSGTKIVFSTDQPVAGTSTGCTIDHQVTSVSASTSVYVSYIFGSTQGSDVLSVSITKDGQSFLTPTVIPDTQGFDCFSDTTDLSQLQGWGPGTYHFVVQSNDGKTQATADLTVK